MQLSPAIIYEVRSKLSIVARLVALTPTPPCNSEMSIFLGMFMEAWKSVHARKLN